ncbi:MAG: sigma-54-dependent Fis family transcriptional regulator [Rhodopirellula sp.]|nr:sigma-54-dependent Fis family transcriptional regulator [Rhodopirellula sp.]
MNRRILIIDDDRSMCDLLEADLQARDFEVTTHTRPEDALDDLSGREFDVVLTDLKMPRIDGLEVCRQIVGNRPDVPVVVMTAFGSMETAIAAIRAGAYDFVSKPVELDVLALVLNRAIEHRELQEKVRVLSDAVAQAGSFGELLGESPRMQSLFDELSRVADTETSVLIVGESGTGKELVARALHARSRRQSQPFVAINCAALPEALLESELFGHKRGAFTDARSDRPGLFQQADGGTLFLDEVGEIPLALQPKLLRALEERTARPVGDDKEHPFDVRLVAATNRDLESAVEDGRFREDLFFRINVIQIDLPPLRSRGADVLLIAQHFIEQFARRSGREITGLSEAAARRLMDYAWPGNVRELRNAMERSVALTRVDQISVDDLPEKIRVYRRTQLDLGSDDPAQLQTLEEVERRYIEHVLKATGNSRTQAARILGLDRKTLYRKLKQYEGETGE